MPLELAQPPLIYRKEATPDDDVSYNAADFPQGRAWIELDRSALLHNVRVLRALLPKGCELMPAVKANAYGHGAALVAGELQRAGIGSFCVASAAEAVELRKAGITGEILILGYTHPRQFSLLRHFHLTQTVLDHDYAELLNRSGRKIDVLHIKATPGCTVWGNDASISII